MYPQLKFRRHHTGSRLTKACRSIAIGSTGFVLLGIALGATTPSAGSSPDPNAAEITVPIDIDSRIEETSDTEFAAFVVATLNDPRSWKAAGFTFVSDPDAEYHVVLDEPSEVDAICDELKTNGKVSCQNGPYVALNADRWREAVPHWDKDLTAYRTYLVNHEVGHLIGQRHPASRCPVAGYPAALMEQQTKSLDGCTGNSWPLWWEIDRAKARPVVFAPPPSWKPDPVPENLGGSIPAPTTTTAAAVPAAGPTGTSGAGLTPALPSGDSGATAGVVSGASGANTATTVSATTGVSEPSESTAPANQPDQGSGAIDDSNAGLGALPVSAEESQSFWTIPKVALAVLLAAAAGCALLWLFLKRRRAESTATTPSESDSTSVSNTGATGGPADLPTGSPTAAATATAVPAIAPRPTYRWDCHLYEDDAGKFLQFGSSFFYPARHGDPAIDALARLDEFVETQRPSGAALHELVSSERSNLIGDTADSVPFMFASSKKQRLYLMTAGGASVRIERAEGQILDRINFTARISASADNPARSVLVEFHDADGLTPNEGGGASQPESENEFAIEFVSERTDP